MADTENKDTPEDLAVKAGFMIVKKELEEKTGQYSSQRERKTINQDEFLKKLREKKKKNIELNIDIFTLRHSYDYTDDIDVESVIEYTKEKAWENPKDIKLLTILGVAYMVLGEYSKAEIEFKKISNIDKYNTDLLYNSAELSIRKGNLKDGIDYLTQLLKKNKDDINALYLMAIIFFLKNNNTNCINIIAQPLKMDKEFLRVHKNFALLSILKKNFEKTEEILKKINENVIKNIWGRITLQSLFLKERKLDEYISEEKILENIVGEKNSIYTPCMLVNKGVYEEINNGEFCEDYFKEAIRINNNCVCGIIEYTKYLLKNKKYTEANETIKKALTLVPVFKPILAILLKINVYLKLEKETDEVVEKILLIDKEAMVRIFNKEKTIYSIGLDKIKNNFLKNISILLAKFNSNQEIDFEIDDVEMCVLKLYRDMKLCDILVNILKE